MTTREMHRLPFRSSLRRGSADLRFPIQPLLDLMDPTPFEVEDRHDSRAGMLARKLATTFPSSNRSIEQRIYRWRRNGMTLDEADAVACALGIHPVQVWPDWYQEDIDA